MSNPFLTCDSDKLETAIIYDKARRVDTDLAPAYTDGERIFVNTDENLEKLLEVYDLGMLEWLLWHEQTHIRLGHSKRYFAYLEKLEKSHETMTVTPEEVNIIMDILVHDWMIPRFPDLVETAAINMAQFRNRNALSYTFKTYTFEKMLDEYRKYKEEKEEEGEGKEGKEGKESKEGEDKKDDTSSGEKKTHKGSTGIETPSETEEPEVKEKEATKPAALPSEHHKTDWSKLKSSKEFITTSHADRLDEKVNKLKHKKIKLGRLTQKLNSLATSKRSRTYRLPSLLQTNDGCIFKGKTPGRTELYLVFDASGSMSGEINTFKEIISRSIPQAMRCPCEWFAGYGEKIPSYKSEEDVEGYDNSYFKGTFKDFLPVRASSGFCDDGDRTIELCYLAEQQGFTPIGVTDGGGCITWSIDKLKQLKRTTLVGHGSKWLKRVKEINPNVQILDIRS